MPVKIKAPASERCNRNHPLSPNQRRKRRQEEAAARQAEYDELTWEEKVKKWGEPVAQGFGKGEKQKAKLSRISIPVEEDLI